MDAASLIVRAGYDGTELTRGLQKSASDIQRFGNDLRGLNATTFKLPDISKDTLVAGAAFRTMGVAMKDVQREFAALGLAFDQTSGRFRNTGTGRFVSEIKGMEALSGVIQRLKADAQALAQVDAAIRSQIAVLVEGARMANTQAASLKELRTVYAQLSREIATSNPPLERRIQLERELVRIRQQFAAVSAASRPSVVADFGAAAIPAQRTAQALGDVSAKANAASRSFALINRTTGEFTQAGRKASGAAIGIAFGLEALARGGTAAEGGLRTALRSVASFAAFFGPKGLIVSGVAAATAAIIDLFKRSREEMEKTQEDFATRITEMIRGADTTGLQQELKNLLEGVKQFNPATGVMEAVNGIKQLERDSAKAVVNADTLSGILSRGFREIQANREIDKTNAKLEQARKLAAQLRALLENLNSSMVDTPLVGRTPVKSTTKSDADLAADAFKRMKEQVDQTTKSAEQLTGNIVAQRDLGIRMVALYDAANTMLGRQKGLSGETVNDLRDMVARLKEFGEVQSTLLRRKFPVVPTISVDPTQLKSTFEKTLFQERFFIPVIPFLGPLSPLISAIRDIPDLEVPVTLKPQFDPNGLQNFKGLLKQIEDAQGLLDFSKLTGDAGFQRDAEENLDRLQKRLENFAKSIQVAMAIAKVPLEVQRKIMLEIVRLQKEIRDGDDDATADLAENIRSITTAGRGLLQTADGLGLISNRARQAADGVLQLADAVASLQSTSGLAKLAGVIGVIGGVASLLQSLGFIGASPQDQERDRILQANNDELARLSVELRGFADSIGERINLATQLDSLIPAFERFALARPERTAIGRLDFDPVTLARNDLLKQMDAFGLNLQELAAVAKRDGFEILDSTGRLIPEAMAQWAAGLRKAAELAVKFGDSFAEAREGLSLLNRVRGITEDPARIIADNVALFKQFAPKLFDEFFKGVNFNDPAAVRAAMDRFLTRWLDQSLDPIDPAMFGGLEPTEVRSILDAWLTAFEKTTDAANALTDSLLNLPAAFKIERYRSAATMAWFNPNVARAPLPSPPIGGPSLPVPSGGTTSARTAGVTIHVENLTVQTQAKSAEVMLNELTPLIKQKARAYGLYAKGADIFDV